MTQSPIYDFFCIAKIGTGGIPPFSRVLTKLHGLLLSIGEAHSGNHEHLALLEKEPFSAVNANITRDLNAHLGADFQHTININLMGKTHSVVYISQRFK